MSQTVEPGAGGVKPGMSTGMKWLVGCAVVAVVFVVICAAISAVGVWFGKKVYDKAIGQYEQQGYAKVMASGPEYAVNETVKGKTLYVGANVKIMAGSDADLAILGQFAEIHGKVNGNVNFMGDTITIAEDGEVTGDVDVTAKTVNVLGTVDGNVTGKMGNLSQQGKVLKGQAAPESTEGAPGAEVESTETTTSTAPSGAVVMTFAANEVAAQSTACGATLAPSVESTSPSVQSTATAEAAPAVTGAKPARAKG